MTLEYFDNVEEVNLSRLISQYQNKPNIGNWIRAKSRLQQMLFDEIEKLDTLRSLDEAKGVNLDNLGESYNVLRGGFNDLEYRNIIKATIISYYSSGTFDEIIQSLELIFGLSVEILLDEVFPGKIQVSIIGISDESLELSKEQITTIMNRATAAGVSFEPLIYSPAGKFFGFAGDTRPNASGFGDVNDSSKGGFFASLF